MKRGERAGQALHGGRSVEKQLLTKRSQARSTLMRCKRQVTPCKNYESRSLGVNDSGGRSQMQIRTCGRIIGGRLRGEEESGEKARERDGSLPH